MYAAEFQIHCSLREMGQDRLARAVADTPSEVATSTMGMRLAAHAVL